MISAHLDVVVPQTRDDLRTDAPKCPISGRAMRPWLNVPIDSMKAAPNRFRSVYWCEASGYGRVHPLPSAAESAEFYAFDAYYTHRDEQASEPLRRTILDRVRTHLAWRLDRGLCLNAERVQRVASAPGTRVCDLGCGSGDLAHALAQRGYRVVGVDPDPNAAARRCDDIEFMTGSAEQLPEQLASRRFDVVTMSHVLEHTIDPAAALKNVFRLLEPGGALLCEVPNNAAIGLRVGGVSWRMLDVPRHLHFFTLQSLRALCQQLGFVEQGHYLCHYQRQFSNDWIAAEGELWDTLAVSPESSPLGPRNSKLQAWKLLARSLAQPSELRYDSVGIIVRRPAETRS